MSRFWLIVSLLTAMSEDDTPPDNWLQQLKKRLRRRHSDAAEDVGDTSADQDNWDGVAPTKMSDDDDPPSIRPPGV